MEIKNAVIPRLKLSGILSTITGLTIAKILQTNHHLQEIRREMYGRLQNKNRRYC